jgi:hypothetical protein
MTFTSAESASIVISTISAALLTVAVTTTEPVGVAVSELWQLGSANAQALDLAHGTPAADIADPNILKNIRVESSTGDKIGNSTAPTLNAQGKVIAIGVSMGGLFGVGTTVKKMDAADLIYLHGRRTLVSRLTKSEIAALPVAKRTKPSL